MIITRNRTQMDGKVNTIRCPVCGKGRICDVKGKLIRGAHMISTEFLIKCPKCNASIGITVE